jgi:hypothetical protein
MKTRKRRVLVSRTKMQKLIKSGRAAIEFCMLEVIVRPRAMNDADNAEMERLTELHRMYNELMAPFERALEASGAPSTGHGDRQ